MYQTIFLQKKIAKEKRSNKIQKNKIWIQNKKMKLLLYKNKNNFKALRHSDISSLIIRCIRMK